LISLSYTIFKAEKPLIAELLVLAMARLKCKKCGNVFEKGFSGAVLAPHVGPYHVMKCPACGKRSWFNVYSSVKNPVTWPPQEKQEQTVEPELTEEELEKKRIEESKYEKP
jgi:RNase P subunit RPR2